MTGSRFPNSGVQSFPWQQQCSRLCELHQWFPLKPQVLPVCKHCWELDMRVSSFAGSTPGANRVMLSTLAMPLVFAMVVVPAGIAATIASDMAGNGEAAARDGADLATDP